MLYKPQNKVITEDELRIAFNLYQAILAKSEKTYETKNKLIVTFNGIEYELTKETITDISVLKGIMLAVIINSLGNDIFNIKQINSDINDNNMQ